MSTTVINRSCYVTREEVQRSLDIKHASYNRNQIDRQIMSSSESVDALCKRIFHPQDDFRYFDWPNYQYAYPWRLWLDANELALDQNGNPNTVLTSGGIVIPNTAFFCRSENYGPPFTRIELDRSQSFSFGNGPTPQRDIKLVGTFGFSANTQAAGSLTAAITTTTQTTISVNTSVQPGVGDAILIDSERMIIVDRTFVDTTIGYGGLSSSQMNDNLLSVPDTTQFSIDEILRVDTERLLILDIITGTEMIVRRAWDGSILNSHTSGTLWAGRNLTVLRAANGSTASTHSNNATISRYYAPPLVQELAVAEAVVGLTQEQSAYAGGVVSSNRVALRTAGSVSEPNPGVGIGDMRNQVYDLYARKTRSRVV